MILEKDNYIEIINAYTAAHWQPLFDLIPEIEASSTFGRVVEGKEVEKGVMQMPYWVSSEVVDRFRQLVYDLGVMINFDWGRWEEGRRMLNEKTFDFDAIDIPDKCKLITAIVRADRFSEGYLSGAFKSGVVLRILKSIEKQVLSG